MIQHWNGQLGSVTQTDGSQFGVKPWLVDPLVLHPVQQRISIHGLDGYIGLTRAMVWMGFWMGFGASSSDPWGPPACSHTR